MCRAACAGKHVHIHPSVSTATAHYITFQCSARMGLVTHSVEPSLVTGLPRANHLMEGKPLTPNLSPSER